MDTKEFTKSIPMEQVSVEDDFWGGIQEKVRTR